MSKGASRASKYVFSLPDGIVEKLLIPIIRRYWIMSKLKRNQHLMNDVRNLIDNQLEMDKYLGTIELLNVKLNEALQIENSRKAAKDTKTIKEQEHVVLLAGIENLVVEVTKIRQKLRELRPSTPCRLTPAEEWDTDPDLQEVFQFLIQTMPINIESWMNWVKKNRISQKDKEMVQFLAEELYPYLNRISCRKDNCHCKEGYEDTDEEEEGENEEDLTEKVETKKNEGKGIEDKVKEGGIEEKEVTKGL